MLYNQYPILISLYLVQNHFERISHDSSEQTQLNHDMNTTISYTINTALNTNIH